MKRYAALGVFALVAVAVLAFVQFGEPAWLQRLRYPLDYKSIVRAHAQNYRLQPRCSPRSSTRRASSTRTRSRRRARSG